MKPEYTKFAVYRNARASMTGTVSFSQWINQMGDEYPELVAILDDMDTARNTAREIPFFETIGGYACKVTRGQWSEIHRIREAEESECKIREDFITVHGIGYALDIEAIETFYPVQ